LKMDVALLVYDVSNPRSEENLEYWYNYAAYISKILVIGNKKDLKKGYVGCEFACYWNLPHMNTGLKDDANLLLLFILHHALGSWDVKILENAVQQKSTPPPPAVSQTEPIYSPLKIRIIPENNDMNKDDILTVTPHWQGDVSMRFECKHTYTHTEGDKTITDTFLLEKKALVRYLYNFFTMMRMDTSPFAFFQFSLPGIPSIMLKQEGLMRYLPIFHDHLDLLTAGAEAWPKRC
jgi:hypothetical protein